MGGFKGIAIGVVIEISCIKIDNIGKGRGTAFCGDEGNEFANAAVFAKGEVQVFCVIAVIYPTARKGFVHFVNSFVQGNFVKRIIGNLVANALAIGPLGRVAFCAFRNASKDGAVIGASVFFAVRAEYRRKIIFGLKCCKIRQIASCPLLKT